MAGGLLALLDDVALIARAAASSVDDVAALAGKTSVKAAGVVVDDAAVTPQYVSGVTPARELPMIWRITKGSLFNKLIIILPVAMVLSWIAPWALTPILMLGGAYLCFEGAEKIYHKLSHPDSADEQAAASVEEKDASAEDKLVKSAITTDLILSAEIMVISLNEVLDQSFWMRLATLVVVAIIITLGVYGAVGLLVKMDDIGLRMLERHDGTSFVGNALVKGMPKVLNAIGVIGTAAMLWVGGHIIIKGIHEFGVAQPHGWIEQMTSAISNGALAWTADTVASMIFGLLCGAIILAVVAGVKSLRH
ncbi:DUF808 domain-containing protein [Corynebacterium sp.]|uniref:DUF808 domain-containing protein n=1 Tax=Corynebacterium sp. TaxID=1720 RepID=UPI0026DD2F37|nr:DUF808 domain-containing protein [Corynebacterium sp.]MDO5032042.1 DUF808 domain-containing protein [Corynebacterium sp.]